MCPPIGFIYMDPFLAINFALDNLEPFEVPMFLKDWREGNLKPWPEYVRYVDEAAQKAVEGDRNVAA